MPWGSAHRGPLKSFVFFALARGAHLRTLTQRGKYGGWGLRDQVTRAIAAHRRIARNHADYRGISDVTLPASCALRKHWWGERTS